MGFLLGAYGKLMAGKRVRELQARMMSVQSQLRRATRDVQNMEKMINAQQKQMLNDIRLQGSMSIFGAQNGVQNQLSAMRADALSKYLDSNGSLKTDLTAEQKTEYNTAFSNYQINASLVNNQFSSWQQMTQMEMQQRQTQIENEIEMMKELQLQPLKDFEEDLQLEKESLESQIQIANNDYEACKEMEKAGAKNMVPQYTGQG